MKKEQNKNFDNALFARMMNNVSKKQTEINFNDINTPFLNIKDKQVNTNHTQYMQNLQDEWSNNLANINAGNSIMRYSMYNHEYTPFIECALLSTDNIINNAIMKITNECLRAGAEINLLTNDEDIENNKSNELEDIKNKLDYKLKTLKFDNVIKKAIQTSLTFGGCLLYYGVDSFNTEYEKPLAKDYNTLSINKINNLRVIEPYLVGASVVNASNPLQSDYMEPSKYMVSGGGVLIDKSRFEKLVIFEAPNLLKPVYNYFGISLPQFMKSSVKRAQIANEALADLFLRFRSIIIKSPLIQQNPEEAIARGQAINSQINNLASLYLTPSEEYIESITPITGLDKITAQFMENIAVAARIPAIKLFGLTPSGFNATGAFDLQSYYDEIRSLQNSVLKPFIENILNTLIKEITPLNLKVEYVFNDIESLNALEQANRDKTLIDIVTAGINAGVISQNEAIKFIKEKNIMTNIDNIDSEKEQKPRDPQEVINEILAKSQDPLNENENEL